MAGIFYYYTVIWVIDNKYMYTWLTVGGRIKKFRGKMSSEKEIGK